VWVAESDDVPGLIAEAETIEALLSKLDALIPELLKLNAIPINLKAERSLVLSHG
jgi:predicted RNase H-like HicB family nuclease